MLNWQYVVCASTFVRMEHDRYVWRSAARQWVQADRKQRGPIQGFHSFARFSTPNKSMDIPEVLKKYRKTFNLDAYGQPV